MMRTEILTEEEEDGAAGKGRKRYLNLFSGSFSLFARDKRLRRAKAF